MPQSTVKAIIRKFKLNCDTIVWTTSQNKKVASWGPQFSKITMRCHLHANRLSGRQARIKPFLSSNHKYKHLDFDSVFYYQMNWKLSFLAANTQDGFGVKTSCLLLRMVEGLWCHRAVFSPKVLGTWAEAKHFESESQNAKKLKMVCHWIIRTIIQNIK